jgi:hypothetical protein
MNVEVTYEPIEEKGVEEEVIKQTFDEMVHDLRNALDDDLIIKVKQRLIEKGMVCFSKDGRTIVTIRKEK